jgi:hypothetical protein
MYQKAEIYSKWSKNTPTFSIPRPSKIYPNLDFWFEDIPSGNPGRRTKESEKKRIEVMR